MRRYMAWKLEYWLKDVFPGEDKIYEEYRALPTRELIIVATAVLDLALVTLIDQRLLAYSQESHAFLGADGDGRAPAGSFGARIQLALLLGIITETDAKVLRSLKKLRNSVAHRVRVDLRKEPYLAQLHDLAQAWRSQANAIISGRHMPGSSDQISEVERYMDTLEEAGAGLVLAVFSAHHAYMHLLSKRMTRIEPFI
jgi:hypothetical protein